MRTHIHPVHTNSSGESGDPIEDRKRKLREENPSWYIGRTSRDDGDPMSGMNGSKVDLTRVLRGRRLPPR